MASQPSKTSSVPQLSVPQIPVFQLQRAETYKFEIIHASQLVLASVRAWHSLRKPATPANLAAFQLSVNGSLALSKKNCLAKAHTPDTLVVKCATEQKIVTHLDCHIKRVRTFIQHFIDRHYLSFATLSPDQVAETLDTSSQELLRSLLNTDTFVCSEKCLLSTPQV